MHSDATTAQLKIEVANEVTRGVPNGIKGRERSGSWGTAGRKEREQLGMPSLCWSVLGSASFPKVGPWPCRIKRLRPVVSRMIFSAELDMVGKFGVRFPHIRVLRGARGRTVGCWRFGIRAGPPLARAPPRGRSRSISSALAMPNTLRPAGRFCIRALLPILTSRSIHHALQPFPRPD